MKKHIYKTAMMVTAYKLQDKWKREHEVIVESSGAKWWSINRKQASIASYKARCCITCKLFWSCKSHVYKTGFLLSQTNPLYLQYKVNILWLCMWPANYCMYSSRYKLTPFVMCWSEIKQHWSTTFYCCSSRQSKNGSV